MQLYICDTERLFLVRAEMPDYWVSDWVHVGFFKMCKSAEWYTSVKLIKDWAFETTAHANLASLLVRGPAE